MVLCNIVNPTTGERCEKARPFSRGGQWPFCEEHADAWRKDSIVAEKAGVNLDPFFWADWKKNPDQKVKL